MHYLWLVGAILALLSILFIVIYLIIREILKRNRRQQQQQETHRRHVGFRVIQNREEVDEFQHGMYIPRTPTLQPGDSGIDDFCQWSESSTASGPVFPTPYPSNRIDVSRRFKSVSFADSIGIRRVKYDRSCSNLTDMVGVIRTYDQRDTSMTSFSTRGHNYRMQWKPIRSKSLGADTQKQDESYEAGETEFLNDLPVTSL